MREWRNWRYASALEADVLVACGFESHLSHQFYISVLFIPEESVLVSAHLSCTHGMVREAFKRVYTKMLTGC